MSRLIRQICSSTFYGTLSPRFIHQDGWYVSLWECGNDMEWHVPVKCSKSSSCINFMKCQTNCWLWDLAVQIGYSSVTVRNKHMFDMGFCTLRWTLPHFFCDTSTCWEGLFTSELTDNPSCNWYGSSLVHFAEDCFIQLQVCIQSDSSVSIPIDCETSGS